MCIYIYIYIYTHIYVLKILEVFRNRSTHVGCPHVASDKIAQIVK